jgi:transcriptional regulator
MYIPQSFEENNINELHELIRAHPLSVLVTMKNGVPEVNHIPLLLSEGVLTGHIARANTLWKDHPQEAEVIAVFHGPENYISPSWYATKEESGKVVPTWNYTAVHAKGKIRFIHEAEWLIRHLGEITSHNEKPFPQPWQVSDAPSEYIEQLVKAVVGIEIQITSLQGKWKVSQNRPEVDRKSVVENLNASGFSEMASLVAKKGA